MLSDKKARRLKFLRLSLYVRFSSQAHDPVLDSAIIWPRHSCTKIPMQIYVKVHQSLLSARPPVVHNRKGGHISNTMYQSETLLPRTLPLVSPDADTAPLKTICAVCKILLQYFLSCFLLITSALHRSIRHTELEESSSVLRGRGTASCLRGKTIQGKVWGRVFLGSTNHGVA